jgi:hypothetical protein
VAAAGLLIQTAPPAWAARTVAVDGMVAARRRGIPPDRWRSRAAATCTWSVMAAAAQLYRRTGTGSETSV